VRCAKAAGRKNVFDPKPGIIERTDATNATGAGLKSSVIYPRLLADLNREARMSLAWFRLSLDKADGTG
jgi:hypothetical protein